MESPARVSAGGIAAMNDFPLGHGVRCSGAVAPRPARLAHGAASARSMDRRG